MGEEQALASSEEDDVRPTSAPQNGAVDTGMPLQIHENLSAPHQLSQTSVIRWERFLPIRSLKVLLVENDDSTRHVVSALLRNCSYEVSTAANGFQAWKMLENMNNHVDLVLTEVVMPVLSGIGLLTKIMSHKTLKNIPVIMMSSHDSMGIVFKCLSKGAVDFLVKPIRKNELKNLWQHVWRRCHSSSGSGSESGTQAKNSVKPRNAEDSGSDSDSSQEMDDGESNGIGVRDGSDNGSGTQSSWTKREADSPQTADAPDSTCAQVIIAKPEASENPKNDDAVLRETPALREAEREGENADGRTPAFSVGQETLTKDDRNLLRHSDLSAFSKYNTASSANQGPTGNVGSCSPVENSLKTETGYNVTFHLNGAGLNQQSNGSSNNDIASTAKNVIRKSEKSETSSAFKQNDRVWSSKLILTPKVEYSDASRSKTQFRQVPDADEKVIGNYSTNGSGTGSNYEQNKFVPCMINETQCDNKEDNANGNAEEDRAAQREAALLKFRQKRKERCFEKRVRYQSRKKLAEQRPRIKGQFVRQTRSTNSGEQ